MIPTELRERPRTNYSGTIWGSRLISDKENICEERRVMTLLQGVLTNSPSKTLNKHSAHQHFRAFFPAQNQDVRGGAPATRRTRRTVDPPSSRPSARRRHCPLTSSTPSVRPQPHPLSVCPRPEVDSAALRRRRRGRGSASGETGPGLVFVNLPRSRRGQRRPRGWHGVLRPGGGAAQRGRQREAAPGRFLKQIVNFIQRIQLENQDWQTFSSGSRQEPSRDQGFLEHLSLLWRTLNSV